MKTFVVLGQQKRKVDNHVKKRRFIVTAGDLIEAMESAATYADSYYQCGSLYITFCEEIEGVVSFDSYSPD